MHSYAVCKTDDIWKWEDELGKCLACADGSSHAAITLFGHMAESNPSRLQRYRCPPQMARQTGNLKADRLNDALTDRLTVRRPGRASFFSMLIDVTEREKLTGL